MKEIIYITLYTSLALVLLTFLTNKLYKLKESNKTFKNLAIFIYNYSYLILIGISISFMIFDFSFSIQEMISKYSAII